MNAHTKLAQSMSATIWSSRQLDTIKRTVAKDTNDDEFNLLIEYCKVKQLDPFSKQVIAIVFNKDKPDKRQMTLVTTQEGYRALAARCSDYRPAETEPVYEYDEKLKSPTNPHGIVKCSVTLWKQDQRSTQWHPVNGVAYWDEHSAAKEEWVYDQEAGKRKPTGKKTLEDNWRRMGRLMIAKCATSMALRAGWPAVFAGVYSEEEIDRSKVIDLTASEIVALEAEDRRAKAIGMAADEYPWVDSQGMLTFVPAGRYGDVIIQATGLCKTVADLNSMQLRNREGMQRFWTKHKDDALSIKAELEHIAKKLPVAA